MCMFVCLLRACNMKVYSSKCNLRRDRDEMKATNGVRRKILQWSGTHSGQQPQPQQQHIIHKFYWFCIKIVCNLPTTTTKTTAQHFISGWGGDPLYIFELITHSEVNWVLHGVVPCGLIWTTNIYQIKNFFFHKICSYIVDSIRKEKCVWYISLLSVWLNGWGGGNCARYCCIIQQLIT